MSADFSQLERFRDQMQQLSTQKCGEFCDECAKELSARLLAKVVRRTPTGTPPNEFDDRRKRTETETVTGADGVRRRFLTNDASRYQQYWAGYVGGTLKRGWTAGQQVSNVSDYARSLPVNVMSSNHVITIINQVEYASYVEYGHTQAPGRYVPALGKKLKWSWIPGKLMLTKSVAEVNSIADQVVQRKLNRFLEGVFENS